MVLQDSDEDDVASISSLMEVTVKINSMKKKLLREKSRLQMFIRRDNLLDDVMEQIESVNPLYVRYEGGIGEDLNGLSKELFSDFWIQFLQRFGRGKNRFFFCLSVEKAPQKKHLVAAGRMLILGFLLFQYIPTFINDAVLFFLLRHLLMN